MAGNKPLRNRNKKKNNEKNSNNNNDNSNENSNNNKKNVVNNKKSKKNISSSGLLMSQSPIILFLFVSLPCMFLAGMLISSLVSPTADAFWHKHFWHRILPNPTQEYLDNHPWAALANDMMYDMPVKPRDTLPVDVNVHLHQNGNCCENGVAINLLKDFTWSDIEQTLHANLPPHLKADKELTYFSNDFEITSMELFLKSFVQNNENNHDAIFHLMYVKGNAKFVWSSRHVGHKFQPTNVVSGNIKKPITLETLSTSPRVFRVSNFLTDEEIEHLKSYAMEKLKRSTVGVGNTAFSDHRTSRTAWDTTSKISLKIQHRAYDLVRLKYQRDTTDAIQIIRYLPGQTYIGHTDYFDSGYDNTDPSQMDGTNRIVTIFCYLSDVEEGGATVFPKSKSHRVDMSARYLATQQSLINLNKQLGNECEILKDGSTDCSKASLMTNVSKFRECLGFRKTVNCDPNAAIEEGAELVKCDEPINHGTSGYCECGGGRTAMEVTCEHSHFTCKSACAGKNSDGGNETTGDKNFDDFLKECGDGDGLAVYPKKGDAVLFYSQTPDAHVDPNSYHGGCPIIKGDKWGANVWIWNRPRPYFGKTKKKDGTMESNNVHLAFVNTRPKSVDLFWLNHDKELQKFHTFQPGASWTCNSHVGHVWVAKYTTEINQEVGRWVTSKSSNTIEI
jgi:hypothetical protein